MKAGKVDSSGNIFIAGQTSTSGGAGVAYVAKLSSDGTTLYSVTVGGSGSSTSAATALDIDSAGAAYVVGTTTASDFPVTAGAVQTAGATVFAVKLDGNGNTVYSALIGGNANTRPSSIVVNSKKELVVSGQSLLKLSADGTQVVVGPQGIAGLVAVDSQDNIYVAGAPLAGSSEPTGSSVPLNLPVVVTPSCSGTFCYPTPAFVSAGSLAGSISGVTQVQLRAPANPYNGKPFQAVFSLSAGATAVRDTNLSFWVE